MSAREHLRPQYAKAFRCIGAECDDTCCHGFAVPIDRATYKRYEATSEMQPLLETHFVLLGRAGTDSSYARIKMTASCDCPFLGADRLCGIQKAHGPDYLSETCANYPRAERRIDGLIEKALYLSCPEAARLVLLDPHLMTADMGASGGRSPYFRLLQAGESAKQGNGSAHQYLWEIRTLTLALLQDRSYPLWQRMFILGTFCKRLKELLAAREDALVPGLLRDYAGIIVEGKLRELMDGIPRRPEARVALAFEVIHRHLAIQLEGPAHERFRECARDFVSGIGYDERTGIEACVPAFEEARARYYEPFLEERPYFLENYLVNHVFKTRFPFGVNAGGEANNPQTEFLMMEFLFAAIAGLLTGIAGRYREAFSTQQAVKLVQSFSKAVEHCPELTANVNPELASANGMALLLKP